MKAAASRMAVAAGYYSVSVTNTSARLPRPYPRYITLTMPELDPVLVTRAAPRPAADRLQRRRTGSAYGGGADAFIAFRASVSR